MDGVEITPDEIYIWADSNEETPKTSAIGFEEATAIMQPLTEIEDEMIIFTISGKMSTTNNVFRMVAEELELEDKFGRWSNIFTLWAWYFRCVVYE